MVVAPSPGGRLFFDGCEIRLAIGPRRGDHQGIGVVDSRQRQLGLDRLHARWKSGLLVNWKSVTLFGVTVAPLQSCATSNYRVSADRAAWRAASQYSPVPRCRPRAPRWREPSWRGRSSSSPGFVVESPPSLSPHAASMTAAATAAIPNSTSPTKRRLITARINRRRWREHPPEGMSRLSACTSRRKGCSLHVCSDAPGTIRTCDPQLRKLVLYPLSYGRVGRAV